MNIKILVCYHKPSLIMANEVLQPIFVGSKQAKYSTITELEQMCSQQNSILLKDNVGDDNISELNPYFCELTAMYWAWKNLDADYYGLFHYRRVFDFSGRKYKNNNDFHFVKISNNIPSFFNITKTSLEQICCNYDIIASNKIIVPGCFEKDYLNNFTQYEIYAKDHYISDLDIVIDIIRKKYPYYEKALQKILFTKGQHISWCNMFIMRKDLYFEYCAWLFDILFEAKQYIPYEIYDDYQKRVFGFLAERLFNVFIFHQKINKNITRKNIKICEKNVCCLKDKRPKFGWQTIDNKKRFYVLGIRILKQIIK